MGAWIHNGSPKRCFKVERNEHGKVEKIVHEAYNSKIEHPNIYTLKRVYYVNKASRDVRKIVSTLQGNFYEVTVIEIYIAYIARMFISKMSLYIYNIYIYNNNI